MSENRVVLTSLRHARRLIAGSLLLAYAVAATGLPLSVPQAKPATDERFPCEHCSCGCATADYCWTRCCCHSMGERLAWAERENVRPPESALRLAQCQGLDVRRWLPDVALPTTLVATAAAKPKCCCCCQKKTQQPEESADEEPPRGTSWRQLACGGALQFWMTISVALPIAGPDFASAEADGPRPAIVETLYASCLPAPSTPPPELRA